MSENKDILNDILDNYPDNEANENDASDTPKAHADEAASEVNETSETENDTVSHATENSGYYAENNTEADIPAPTHRSYRPQDYNMRDNGPMIRPAPPKKKKKKKKKKKASRLPGVLILVTLIFGISIISSLVIISFGKDMLGIGKSEETHVFVVPENATTQDIATMLFNQHIINSADAFKLFADFSDPEMVYVSGEHFIRPNMPYETLIDELTKVPSEEMGESIEVTFPEGTNLIEAAYILEENYICDAEEFIFYFNAGGFGVDFENQLPTDTSLKFQRMEGYLFPDTYFFYENSTPEEVCQKIYYNFDTKMNSEFSIGKTTYENRYKRMKELNMSLDQLITLASIVQQEAASREVMDDVAAVFINRLDHPDEFPLLQSDPTSNYSSKVIRPNMVYFDQTIVDSYDTYKSPGLPPGAICNPGIDAIDAVLTSKKTKNYYFIANIHTKETLFAETLEQHELNQEEIERQYAEEEYEDE